MDSYATHIPALVHAAVNASGPILELGAGDYSTPLLHALGREAWTLDSDADWLKRFEALQCDRIVGACQHRFIEIPDWNDLNNFGRDIEPWGVVFVDFGGPQYMLRGWSAGLFRSCADFIVCHDSEAPAYYGYDAIWRLFRHRARYVRWPKQTMILSDVREIPPLESLEVLS
jgi:hypothetical protein